jgi:hypothetical protein
MESQEKNQFFLFLKKPFRNSVSKGFFRFAKNFI